MISRMEMGNVKNTPKPKRVLRLFENIRTMKLGMCLFWYQLFHII